MTRPEPSAADRIAREAARLYQAGKAASIREAIARAARRLGLEESEPPGEGRVRQHVQAMAMQSLGQAGYRHEVRRVLSAAEELMTAMEEMVGGAHALLMGRAARGHVDGEVRLHIRLYTAVPVEELARRLAELGYDDQHFETRNSPHGRLNRIVLAEDGLEIVVTRCPPSLRADARRNLYTGAPVDVATVKDVRAMIEKLPGQ